MKNKNMKIVSFLLLALVIVVSGCSDRGTNQPDPLAIQEGGISPQNHNIFSELTFQIENEFQLIQMAVYVPKASLSPIYGGELKPVPLLILLAPEDGDRYYYFNHGLKQIVDELISDGTIEPMAIACIGNDKTFGGYFWAGHYPNSGNLDIVVGDSIVSYLERSYPFVISNDPSKRGIGGFGQGAYGAYRAGILNPGKFGSISGTDGPLDFDGVGGVGGLDELFDDAIAEQTSLIGDFDSLKALGSQPISRMFFGGAFAFSAYDTLYNWHWDNIILKVIIDQIYSLDSDSTSLVKLLVPTKDNRSEGDFHLPFTVDGQVNNFIWDNYWVPNNLENMLTPGVFNNVDLWLATSTDANFGNYHQQTQSWINTLSSEYSVSTMTYTGYDGKPSTRGEFDYDLLRELLIFHNESFTD